MKQNIELNAVLEFFANQLEVTVEESQTDYDIISKFCLNEIENVNEKTELVKSLQSYDLSYQRIQHVIYLLQHLVQKKRQSDILIADDDFINGCKKIDSFYNEDHACYLLNVIDIEKNIGHASKSGDDHDAEWF